MACFIVPAAEAAAVKVADVVLKKAGKGSDEKKEQKEVNPFVKHLPWLTRLLTGGSVLLAFEHVWHGEVTPFFPFLTAMETAESTSEMLHEMATAGVGMAVLCTVVWVGMVMVSHAIEKRPAGALKA
ncbi:MAG: hypothetical protein J5825_07010 [Lachnospiraceae bacterium]|nr:hypothetical protein [Lachnospiraceae bacterium]